MARAPHPVAAGTTETSELEAMAVLQEVRENGGYVLVDLQGSIHVRHIARVPPGLRSRVIRYYPEIVRLLLKSVEYSASG